MTENGSNHQRPMIGTIFHGEMILSVMCFIETSFIDQLFTGPAFVADLFNDFLSNDFLNIIKVNFIPAVKLNLVTNIDFEVSI